MRRLLSGTILILISCTIAAQERFGLAHSNYAGTDAAYLNPARPAGQWPYADIRFIGFDLSAWNSLVAWSNREQRLFGELRSGIAGTATGQIGLRNGMSNSTVRGFVQANVLGPAFSLSLGRGTIGAGIRTRSYTSVTGGSAALGDLIYRGLQYVPNHGTRYQEHGMRAIAAAWTEFSVGYAHMLKVEGFSILSAGATLKYHLGHAGGALSFNNLDFTVVDTARLVVHDATLNYGFAMPAANAGAGWGADIGVNYERTMDEADGYMPHRAFGGCDPKRYRYRIGLSLIDLGGIRFKNAESGNISAGTAQVADHTRIPVDDIESLDSLMTTATNWQMEDRFKIGAPTAVSLQYDQRITDHAYVAFAAVQNVSGRNSTRLRRTNSIAMSPRYETKRFEAALPIVLHEYDLRHPSVGLMMRLNGLVIGSDHILPFINKRDIYGADIYFRLRWMILRSPFCKGKRASSARFRVGSTQALPCAQPN